ncbi:hypothetical protein FVQ98_17160 [Ottowia sp. GY511]|uniref:hypothetical protein n=1 Tax=Ottowia sp. GY511 TaxID=2603274 RepID=UPI0011C8D96A|nr:hypothetical protein [Ottowia sp. GY511]TXK23413.1 hypothetical protein FVQ98_17160 [Ottowia sp. GY511]
MEQEPNSLERGSAPGTSVDNEAGEVSAEEGMVVMDGPASTSLTMTPEVARLTGERLCSAADDAERQASDLKPR